MANEEALARGLGWFSIGLGAGSLVAPGAIARMMGIRDNDDNCSILRAIGVREIVSGIGILSARRPTGWIWSRVAGDAMDLSLTARCLAAPDVGRGSLMATMAALAAIGGADLYCGMQLTRTGNREEGQDQAKQGLDVKKTITIKRSPDEVYGFWHDFRNLPRFMSHLQSVEMTGSNRSHWRANAPGGRAVEWDAETVEDRPSELIAWRSTAGSQIENSGSVRFKSAPGGRGTEVHVAMRYNPPAGSVGAVIAKLFGEEPSVQIEDDLRHLKQVLELGEVVKSDGNPAGRLTSERPGQPLPA